MSVPSLTQFRRAYRLEIGSIKVESLNAAPNLRIAFEVVRKNRPEPNAAKIQIWNLNPDHRAQLEALDDVPVRLSVGYEDTVKQIFFGALGRASSTHDATEWITEVAGGDGTTPLRTARIAKSFRAGTPLSTVLKALVSGLGVGTGNILTADATLAGKALSHGLTISGPISEELSGFCDSQGLEWSIQDGDFYVSQTLPPRPATEGPLISPTTGLIGSPVVQKAKKGKNASKEHLVSCKALIIPELLPGLPYRLESSRVTGNLLAVETRHTGDSNEQDWYVEVKGKLL